MTASVRLSNFLHLVGAHCSSTSVQNVLRYDGIELSEAMVFGLGAGLGFWYLHDPDTSPTHRFNGRAPDLEGNFYRHIGHLLQWAEEWSPTEMAAQLSAGRPLLAQTDIYHLPYYDPPVHFPGHGIVVTGIDLPAQTIDLADIQSPDHYTIALADFQQAVGHYHPPMLWSNHWAAPPKLTADRVATEIVTPETLRQSILTVTQRMLTPPDKSEGLPAMQQMAEVLPTWGEAPDFVWAARFAYQAIEKRGTGGGGFRTLYSAFLAEAEAHLPALATIDSAQRTNALGEQWRVLAGHFKQIFIKQEPTKFQAASAVLQQIVDEEAGLMAALAQAAQ